MLDVVRTSTALKTGSLVRLATELGALLSGASDAEREAIGRFGLEFGVALQMLDDLSGLTNEARCHKGHEDLLNGRPSWVWAWLAMHRDDVTFARLQHRQRDVESRDLHPEILAQELRATLGTLIQSEVSRHLEAAVDELRRTLPADRDLSFLIHKLEHLERAYL
jgi:geranylgeranyl pyrophosphate synthase